MIAALTSANLVLRLLPQRGSPALAPKVSWSPESTSNGIAADHGLSTGDVILEMGGKSVSTPADVRAVVANARTEGKRSVLIRVKKGDNTRFVALPLGQG